MARELTQAVKEQIWALAHLPQRDIARRLGVGLATVSRVLASTAAPVQAPAEPSQSAPADDVDAAVALGEELVTAGTNVELLRASLVRLERAGRVAGDDRDVARVVSCERVYGQTLAKIDQLERQALADKKDPEAGPDVVAAAERFRAGMRAGLDRILAELAAK